VTNQQQEKGSADRRETLARELFEIFGIKVYGRELPGGWDGHDASFEQERWYNYADHLLRKIREANATAGPDSKPYSSFVVSEDQAQHVEEVQRSYAGDE